MDVEKLLAENGILPDSPIGKVITQLVLRIERLEAEVLPREPDNEIGLP